MKVLNALCFTEEPKLLVAATCDLDVKVVFLNLNITCELGKKRKSGLKASNVVEMKENRKNYMLAASVFVTMVNTANIIGSIVSA